MEKWIAVGAMMARTAYWAAVVVLAAGCCGKGAAVQTASDWETPEYQRQGGLALIKASSMYARGGTGKGVTVGLLDTGATPGHPDLAGTYVVIDSFEGVDPMDTNPEFHGHGTHVAGIMAARKDDSGMHGVAYEARLASYALEFDENDDVVDFELGKATDELTTFGVRIVNNSWGKVDVNNHHISITITDVNRQEMDAYFPHGLPAYRRYVDAGGVQVWGVGNSRLPEVSFHAGLPHLVPELERGWLAVISVGLDGDLADYSQQCGVAAAWCIAAPGGDRLGERRDAGIYSTVPGGYDRSEGTSFAAPQVSGALAALKSMFPNLGFQDVRDRILFTADRTGIYAAPSIYGQGLLDLDAASRPIGGTLFSLGQFDDGPVATTQGARLSLSAGAVSRYLAGEEILVLDRYQRAPFRVPISRYAGARGGGLSMRDLELIVPSRLSADDGEASGLAFAGQDFQVSGTSNGPWRLSVGHGSGLVEGFAGLAGSSLPHGNFRMARNAVGMALGFTSAAGAFHASAVTNLEDAGGAGRGIMGWHPRSVWRASFVGPQARYALGAAFASGLKRPAGLKGTGAFALSGDSVDLGVRRTLFASDAVRVGLENRITYLAPNEGPLIALHQALLATAGLDLSISLTRHVTLKTSVSLERPLDSGEARIRAARSVDAKGRIDYDDIVIDQGALLAFDRVGVSLRYGRGPDAMYGAGVMALRDGFGRMQAIAGARAALRF
ncbi:MAG: S8 family serine peptidase [Nitrospira sp.]|nr:S8 family serine peptidase [Nitrospira sp.]